MGNAALFPDRFLGRFYTASGTSNPLGKRGDEFHEKFFVT
jgi:hypothetical protein